MIFSAFALVYLLVKIGYFEKVQIDPELTYLGLDALSGIINMIAISMLVARMDSKLIGIASILISIIYGYAVIQSLSPLFGDHNMIASASYLLVFVFKIYFFIIIIYALQTGRMLNFFCCSGELSRRIKNTREAFFEKVKSK